MPKQPTLIWNTVRSAWEIPNTENLLCQHLGLFSGTFSSSGMMRNGQVFELPMQALHTTDTESSSSPILRTPAASEGERGHQPEDKARARGGQVTLSGQFLPTPNTMDHLPARNKEDIDFSKGGHRNVRETVVNELPTPTTRDYKDGTAEHHRDGKVQTDTVARAVFNSGEVLLPTTRARMDNASKNELEAGNPYFRIEVEARLIETNWGKFEPAIKRWEATIGRQAPEPTKPDGKDGAHRLSSKFTEWMMGLPDGWITDVGLSRNDELKACGNGVVPQQAELALRILMSND